MTPAEKLAKKLKRGPRNKRDCNGPVVCHIRALRESLGLSMDVVCEAVGFSKAGMSVLERGGDCVMTTALKIAAFYGKRIDELWESPPTVRTARG